MSTRSWRTVADSPVLTSITTDLELNKPQFTIKLNRPKVADLGLDVSVVGRTLETLLGGRQVTRFEIDGEQYDVYHPACRRGPVLAAGALHHLSALAIGRDGAALQCRLRRGERSRRRS